LGRLVLDIHYVEHGSGKAHARRAPSAIEQALAQLVYINFALHGETSYQTRTLLSSAKLIHGSNKSRHLLVVHLHSQTPHGLSFLSPYQNAFT
jgi:arginase family enzyme